MEIKINVIDIFDIKDPEKEALYLNALNLAFQKNFLKIYSFVKNFSSPSLAFSVLEKEKKINIDPLKEWKKLKENKIEFIPFWEDYYPSFLKEIPYFPFGLYFKSKIFSKKNFSELLASHPTLSVVGTRKASLYGKKVVEKLIKDLKDFNFIIISGLAYGIDSLVHKSCLKNNLLTFAVLASGLNNITPLSNYQLSEKILKKGALISEFPLNTPSLKQYFPWRNRIISALSLGTLVVEAPEKSGALITAHFALEQNKELFAIPGSIFDNNSKGCHQLIKNGAKLVENSNDIIEEFLLLSPLLKKSLKKLKKKSDIYPKLDEKEKIIYNFLSPEIPLSFDKIIEKINLTSEEALSILTELELKGLIKENNGFYLKIN